MKKIISTTGSPSAIGPYSQGVESNGFIFVSGQLPLIPVSGVMIAGGISEQTEQCLKNLASVLEAADSGLDNVVKTTVFLKNMDDFSAMNTVYAKYFSEGSPSRAAVEVARLPKDALIEIEAIAVKAHSAY